MIHAKQTQEVALFFRTCGRENFGPFPFRELYRRDPNATGGAVDQDLLPLLEAGKVIERVMNREEGAGDGGGGLERRTGRNQADTAGLGHDTIAETSRRKTENPVSGRKPADSATHTYHNTGELQTQRRSGKAAFDRAVR